LAAGCGPHFRHKPLRFPGGAQLNHGQVAKARLPKKGRILAATAMGSRIDTRPSKIVLTIAGVTSSFCIDISYNLNQRLSEL